MAGELAYVSGLTGKRFDVSDYETVDFEGALELRGREWDYTVRNGGLTGVSRRFPLTCIMVMWLRSTRSCGLLTLIWP